MLSLFVLRTVCPQTARWMRRWMAGCLLFAMAFPNAASELVPVEELGLRVTPGFHATLYADSDLAKDIQALTLDGKGRLVVTGPGYIKILHDTDEDGKADRATLFAAPRSAGQGMCFAGTDLIFAGDGAWWRYRTRTAMARRTVLPNVCRP